MGEARRRALAGMKVRDAKEAAVWRKAQAIAAGRAKTERPKKAARPFINPIAWVLMLTEPRRKKKPEDKLTTGDPHGGPQGTPNALAEPSSDRQSGAVPPSS